MSTSQSHALGFRLLISVAVCSASQIGQQIELPHWTEPELQIHVPRLSSRKVISSRLAVQFENDQAANAANISGYFGATDEHFYGPEVVFKVRMFP